MTMIPKRDEGAEWEVYPIYTREAAFRKNPSYFKSLTHKQAGHINLAVGKIMADFTLAISYFIVRRSHRVERSAQWRQHGSLVNQPFRSTARYYVIGHFEYIVAYQEWDSGDVYELERFTDRSIANEALREYHATSRTEYR